MAKSVLAQLQLRRAEAMYKSAQRLLNRTLPQTQSTRTEPYNVFNTLDLSVIFVTIPYGTIWELPRELNLLDEIQPDEVYGCVGINHNYNTWVLEQMVAANEKKLYVSEGWHEFLADAGYAEGDKFMMAFSRRLRTFYVLLDEVHELPGSF